MNNVKSIADAKSVSGVTVDTLKNVTFTGDSFVKATGAIEPSINGSIWGKKQNDVVGPIKGNNGVYVYQIISQSKQSGKFDAKLQEQMAIQMHMRNLNNLTSDLYLDGKVVDKRYLFF